MSFQHPIPEIDVETLVERLLIPLEKLEVLNLTAIPRTDIQDVYQAYNWIIVGKELAEEARRDSESAYQEISLWEQ
jgi:hypothetical protein